MSLRLPMKKMDVWPCLDYLHSLELPKHHEDMLTLKLAVEKADNLAQHAKKAMGFLFWVGLGNNQVNSQRGSGQLSGGLGWRKICVGHSWKLKISFQFDERCDKFELAQDVGSLNGTFFFVSIKKGWLATNKLGQRLNSKPNQSRKLCFRSSWDLTFAIPMNPENEHV